MTIVSCVYVPEGIAMAADSMLTYTRENNGKLESFSLTENAQKIVLVRSSTIGVCFCGVAILDNQTIADVLRVFDIERVSDSDTVEMVASKLRDFIISKYGMIEIAFIVAGYDDDESFVYLVGPGEVNRANIPNTPDVHGASWRGENVPFANVAAGMKLNATLMPLKDALDFAEFIVDFTVKFQRFNDGFVTCGGPVDLLVITKDYTKFVKHKILGS